MNETITYENGWKITTIKFSDIPDATEADMDREYEVRMKDRKKTA